jgi:transcriptional regulator with XRE-family HTH domain
VSSPHDPTDPPRPALAKLAADMRRLREQAGLSQRALAEQMGYVREYVTLAERGSRLPSREFLVRYAHALDATERLLPLYDAAWREDQAIKRATRVRRFQQTVAAWTAAVEAKAHAARHDAQAALAALDRAEASTREDAEPVWPWLYPFTHTRLAGYRGSCATRLDLHALALPALQQALAGIGSTATKAKALTLTDLAASYLAIADVERACAKAGEALEIGVAHRSQRVVERVLAVRAQMASLQSAVAVHALDQRILATLLPPSGS